MSRRVLIAWEFGSGLGHLACMLPIIRRLREHGLDLVYAVPDPEVAQKVLGAEAPRLIRAVPRPPPSASSPITESFADILLNGGFRNREALAAAVDGWMAIYREERVESVLLDYAPVAQLAAWLMGLPMVSATVSFAVPPVPIPPFQARAAASAAASEQELLACVNHVITRAGRQPMDSLAPWLHAPTRFIKSIPQLDVYDFPPDGGYLGPVGELPPSQEVNWPDSGRKRALCYLRWSRDIPSFINSIDHPSRELLCVIPNAPDDWIRSVPRTRIRIFSKPIYLQQLIREADVVVSNASNGVACQAFLAGKPQLLLPIDQEKALIAQKLVGLNVARSLAKDAPVAKASMTLNLLLDDSKFPAAKMSAALLPPKEWEQSLERMSAMLMHGAAQTPEHHDDLLSTIDR